MSDNDVPGTSESGLGTTGSTGADGGNGVSDVRTELTDAERARLVALDEALQKANTAKRWSDVIKLTLEKAELVIDTAEKVALFREGGRLYLERSSNQAEAIKCYRRVLDIDPNDREALDRLKDLYEKRRDWERLVEVMRAECSLLDAPYQPLRRLELARLATERLRKPNICIDLWQDVLAVDAANAEAITALAGLYERAREWAPLAEILEKKLGQVSDRTETVQLLQKLGTIYGDQLNDDQGAVSAYKRLLDLDPEDRRAQEQLKKRYVAAHAWEDLESFYGATGKWDELIRTLERAADAKESELDERVTLLFRVARLYQERMNAADRAGRAYEKVLALDSGNLEAAEALTPIYEAAGDAKKLASAYEIRISHTDDGDERVLLLREAGLLYEEKLRSPQQAFDKFLHAFAIDPLQEVLRDDLDRLAAKTKAWDRVFEAYGNAIENATHADDALDLRLCFARVLQGAGKVQDAIAQYRAVWNERPDDATALGALEELYRRTEAFGELLKVLERRSELESEPQARKTLAYEMARLADEHLGDVEKAIEAYRTIPIEFGPEEVEAYRALESLYERKERWDDLAQTFEHRIDLGPSTDEELAALKFRLAEVLAERQGDKERGLSLWCEVLTIMPEHEGALGAIEGLLQDPELGARAASVLEPIYEGRSDYTNLVRALEVTAASMPEPESRVDVITRIGELYAEQLRDENKAFETYCRALRQTPGNPGIAARLEDLGRGRSRLPEMVALLSELAGAASDERLARQLWVRAATLLDDPLGDIDGAVAAYSQALELDERDAEVLTALEALYRRTERYRELLGVLRKRAAIEDDPQERERVLGQVAAIHDEMLGEPREAIRIFQEILDADATSLGALSSLESLYERQQMWSELSDNLSSQLSFAEDERARIPLMLRLGALRETRLQAIDAAIETYREILDLDPTNADALAALERLVAQPEHRARIAEILEPLYRDANDIRKLIGVHEIQVAISKSPE